MRRVRGFSLTEVMVASVIIAVTGFGMAGVLARYATTRNFAATLAVAQGVAQAELDDVLMHTMVENSLLADTEGRSRPIYLLNSQLTVSNYFYCNFPWDPDVPGGVDHNEPGMVWDIDALGSGSPRWDRFRDNRLYDRGGAMLQGRTPYDQDVALIGRLQLYGASEPVTNVEEYINGPTSAAYPHGVYLDTASHSPDLIADTCSVEDGFPYAGTDLGHDPRFNAYRTKFVVVRIYTKAVFLSKDAEGRVLNAAGGAKSEVTHAYAIINGKVRL